MYRQTAQGKGTLGIGPDCSRPLRNNRQRSTNRSMLSSKCRFLQFQSSYLQTFQLPNKSFPVQATRHANITLQVLLSQMQQQIAIDHLLSEIIDIALESDLKTPMVGLCTYKLTADWIWLAGLSSSSLAAVCRRDSSFRLQNSRESNHTPAILRFFISFHCCCCPYRFLTFKLEKRRANNS